MTRVGRAAPLAAVVLAVALLAALPTFGPTGSGGSPGGLPAGRSLPAGPVTVAPAFLPGPGVRALGPLSQNATIDVAVGIAPTDPQGLQAQLALEYAAGSPEQGHFLTASAVAARYAPSPSTYDAAVRYFVAAGTSVTVSPDRSMLLVQGSAASIGRAFHTQFDQYASGGRIFYSHPTASVLPPIAPWSGVVGLGNETPAIPFSSPAVPSSPAAGCNGDTPLAPCAVADAYNVSSLYSAGTNGTGVTVGIVDTYDGTEKQPTLANDLAAFAALYGLPVGSVHYLYPVPTAKNLNTTSTGWGTEEALDLEWSRATAPGAALDMTFAPDATAGLYFSVDWLVANQLVNVISLSWGEPDVGAFNTYSTPCSSECNATSDGSYAILHPVLADAALEGIGVFAASGDCGAAMGTAGDATSYPASDPDATGVGATDLTLNGVRWAGETGWSGNDTGATPPGCQNQGGSGGGFSPFPRPVWDMAPGLPAIPEVRGVPDVSIVGGTPVGIVTNGFDEGEEGTSVSTPIWAGLAALADQLHGGPLGLLDPGLYALARGSDPGRYFHDVVSGYNGYEAGTGWDPVTGIGSPNASGLLPALAKGTGLGPATAPVLYASNRTGPAPLNVAFVASVPAGAPAVASYDLYFGDGNATWSASGSASHRFPDAGVYAAQAVVFYTDGDSAASSPVLVLAGTGPGLSVALSINRTQPAMGAPVALLVTTTGGTGPYHVSYYFGDGSYYANATVTTWNHTYGVAGGFCAVVFATDAASPADGGASLEIPVAVGGAPAPSCPDERPMSVTLPPEPAAMDLPANVNLSAAVTGAAGPVELRYLSDDPYVTECQCGIFRIPGNHSIWAYANDSVSGGARTRVNLTVYPALDGSFSAARPGVSDGNPVGPLPLTVDFTASVSGGHDAVASSTAWTFGDGSPGQIGASVVHTYTTTGYYLAAAVLHDGFNGTSAEAFLIDVLPNSTPLAAGISASVDLGAGASAGNLVAFSAGTNSDPGGAQFAWDLGDDDSAFGSEPVQSYTTGCLAADRCPLTVTVNASGSLGPLANATFTLPFDFYGRSSALALSDQVSGDVGPTPFVLNASATTSAMPGARVTWNFGDGNQTVGGSVGHTYYRPGNFTVNETAQDTIGDVEVRSHEVVVTGPPVAPLVFAGGPSTLTGVAPLSITFSANASGGFGAPYTYSWEFGTGATAHGPWANYTYPERGNFTANLSITDQRGTHLVTQWPVQVFNLTRLVLLVAVDPAVAEPNGEVGLNLTLEAVCTVASVTGCSDANATFDVSAPEFEFGGPCAISNLTRLCQLESFAPPTPREYPIWVNGTGFYGGGAEAVVDVVAPGSPPVPPLETELIAGGIAGVVAGVALSATFLRKVPSNTTP